jgi:hypothetical protein
MSRIVCWFSAGAASAVATKLALAEVAPGREIVVARCIVADEDSDNDRFAADCAAWFGQPIIALSSTEYTSAEDVWQRRRYMSGPGGAVCTLEMKKRVRQDFERAWQPDHQVFGYTVEERGRVERFRASNPEVGLVTPLIDAGLGKDECFAIIQRAGLVLPMRYRQGFDNANCKGCVAAQSPSYWNRERRLNPDVFARRATLSRELGVRLVKLTSGERERIFLDELQPDDNSDDGQPMGDCSLLCAIAESRIKEQVA